MNWILAIEQLIKLSSLAWVDLRRWPLPALVGLWVLVQGLVLAIAADPTHPLWSGWVVPLFRWRFGELYLHYPQALAGLADSSAALRLPLVVLLGSWVQLAATAAVLQSARARRIADGTVLAVATRRWPAFLLVALLVQLAWGLLYSLPVSWALREAALSYPLRLALGYGAALLPLLATLPLLYVAPALASGAGLGEALRGSARRVMGGKTIAFLLATLPWVVGLPFDWVLDRSALLANQLRPEMVFLVVLARLVVVQLAAFVMWSGAARLYARPGTRGGGS